MLWKLSCCCLLLGGLWLRAGAQAPGTRAEALPEALLYQDADHDGVVNKYDLCMHQPGPAENDGCPERVAIVPGPYSTGLYARYLPYADPDQDGLPNVYDQCPNQAGLRSLQGCPPPPGKSVNPFEDLPLPPFEAQHLAAWLPLPQPSAAGLPTFALPDSLLHALIRQPHSRIFLWSLPAHTSQTQQLANWLITKGIGSRRIRVISPPPVVQGVEQRALLKRHIALAVVPL